MAAGLGFKDFTTGEVLTAADVDGYLMQGVWVFASAAARDAAVTSPQEGNFAYLKDTNTTTYYTGSAWTNLDTTGMVNPMTTTGDTIYSSSGSTPARLGIGSTGQVLTVSGGVPSWASPAGGGGLTLLSTTSLTGSSVTVSSISQSYKDLRIIIRDVYVSSSDDEFFRLNSDTGSNYNYRDINTVVTSGSGGSGSLSCSAYEDFSKMPVMGSKDDSAVNRRSYAVIDIFRYTESQPKMTVSTAYYCAGSTPNRSMKLVNGIYNSNTAISSFTYFPDSGTFSAGNIYIYGVS